jgi:dTDP-glucose 4,6-dehydratase
MRLLVTGGFGFIGSAFVKRAVAKGHDIVVIDKMTYAADLSNIPDEIQSMVEVSNLDISDQISLENFLNYQANFDWIVNFAAESHVDRSISNGLPFVQSNIVGVVNFLEYIKKVPDTKFFQISTDEVYGTISEGSWDENSPLLPRSAYSSSKASAELFCNAYRNTHNAQILITRSANNFGPYQSAEKLIPTVINSILSGRKVPIYGDGSNRREWLYVDDHVLAVLKIVESGTTSNNIYNLGGIEFSNIEIVNEILRILGKDESSIQYVEDRKGHDFRYSVNDSLFGKEFGVIQNANFQTQLESTVSWYLNNQNWLNRSALRLQA